MKKFEYKYLEIVAYSLGVKSLNELNKLGYEGWEVVSFCEGYSEDKNRRSFIMLLKREIGSE